MHLWKRGVNSSESRGSVEREGKGWGEKGVRLCANLALIVYVSKLEHL
jgi:hypothetical protein